MSRKLTLLPNWKDVLKKAWSIRFIILSSTLGAIEIALPLFSDSFPKHIFLILSIAFGIAAAVSRLIAQVNMASMENSLKGKNDNPGEDTPEA